MKYLRDFFFFKLLIDWYIEEIMQDDFEEFMEVNKLYVVFNVQVFENWEFNIEEMFVDISGFLFFLKQLEEKLKLVFNINFSFLFKWLVWFIIGGFGCLLIKK